MVNNSECDLFMAYKTIAQTKKYADCLINSV